MTFDWANTLSTGISNQAQQVFQDAAEFEQKLRKLASIAPIAYDDLQVRILKEAARSGHWRAVWDDFYTRSCRGDYTWIEETHNHDR